MRVDGERLREAMVYGSCEIEIFSSCLVGVAEEVEIV